MKNKRKERKKEIVVFITIIISVSFWMTERIYREVGLIISVAGAYSSSGQKWLCENGST